MVIPYNAIMTPAARRRDHDTGGTPANRRKTKNDILDDLAESRDQIAEGKGIVMKQALQEIGAKHGFV